MNRISAVYKITNTITGDFYIGSSKNAYQRWGTHKSPSFWKLYPNNPMYQEMQKYGVDKFRFQILCPVIPEYLKEVEQELMEYLKPTYNDYMAKGWDTERYKKSRRKALKKYFDRLCFYNGKTLKLGALTTMFHRAGIEHPAVEATKYLIK